MTLPNTRHFDFSDPALRQNLGLKPEGIATVSKRSQWRKEKKQDHRSRAETQRLILEALQQTYTPLSLREIAQKLGRSKCQWLRDVVADMVTLGLIIERETWFRHLPMFEYEIA